MAINIPSQQNNKFNVVNISDLFGNIWYTKNINFDLQGYIRLSNRSALVKSEQADARFGIIPSFGRASKGEFYLPTAVNPYVTNLGDTQITVSPDPNANKPMGLGFTTAGRWWRNRWHVASPTSLYYRDTTNAPWQNITLPVNANPLGNWDASTNSPTIRSGIGTLGDYYIVNVAGNTIIDGVQVWNVGDWIYFNGTAWVKAVPTSVFNSGNNHAMEVFRNRNTLCVADGNKVLQFDEAYVHQNDTDLIIPSDFEIRGLAYSGNRMGIITRLSSGSQGKNLDAYFFTWDGSSPEANAGYPIGSDLAIAITAYKSSWVILTRKGQLLYFNGGGFDVLGQFPFYYQDQILGDFQNALSYGDALQVNGDYIYINIASDLNTFGIPAQSFAPNFPTGIWCYDPNVGLYHRYSPSISPVSVGLVRQQDVNTTTNEITLFTGASVPKTGDPVRYITDNGNPIGGLELLATYYVINISSSVFQLALTRQDALDGTAIDLTNQGGIAHTFIFLNLLDYGASLSSRVGAIGLQGVYTQAFHQLIYSGYYPGISSSLEYASLCMDIPFLPARGSFVTAKMVSAQVLDEYAKVFIKYRPLQGSDLIILKYKNQDVLGLPISTAQSGCQWVSDVMFTTTQDISDAYDFFQNSGELECDIIGGAGAGQATKVEAFTFATGTYTITLAESIEGVSSGNLFDICLENWKEFGRVNDQDTDDFKELPIEVPSKNLLVKCELRGRPDRLIVESLQIINSTQQESQ